MTNASQEDGIVLHDRPITVNERAWIEFIRLTSHDSDPAPKLKSVQALRRIFTEAGDLGTPA